jgi:DNA polymerase-3 subunit epsilon
MAIEQSRQFVAFDVETTGLAAESDRVIEIGAVRFEESGNELGRFERLVNPERPVPPAASAIHGITDAHLAGAATARTVLPEFIAFLGDPETTTLLAHNAAFDAEFLRCELRRIDCPMPGHTVTDTLALARLRLPHLRNHRLDTLARVLNLGAGRSHRALGDSLRVRALWLALRGHEVALSDLVAYTIHEALGGDAAPVGWEDLTDAIAGGLVVRMEYSGGSRANTARDITPRGFLRRGGITYLVAYCHLDCIEKEFRLDRVRSRVVIR